MSTELPDFTTAEYWTNRKGSSFPASRCHILADSFPDSIAELAPWMPLDTAEAWVQRIDRDALAGVIELAPDPSYAGMGTRHVGMDWAREMAAAVLAALPELIAAAPTLLAELANEMERLQAKVAAFADIEEAHSASYRMLRDRSGMTELVAASIWIQRKDRA